MQALAASARAPAIVLWSVTASRSGQTRSTRAMSNGSPTAGVFRTVTSVVPPAGATERACRALGLSFLAEGFAEGVGSVTGSIVSQYRSDSYSLFGELRVSAVRMASRASSTVS